MRKLLAAVVLLLGAASALAQNPPNRTVAITIDDLPKAYIEGPDAAGEINDLHASIWEMVSALDRHHVPAIGFVNESKLYVPGELEQRIDLLRGWVSRGMTLGNHGFSHADIDKTALPQFEDEIVRGDVISGRVMRDSGKQLKYFRFPYNHTGAKKESCDAIRVFLQQHGYILTPFTVTNDDYIWNDVYVRAKRARNHELAEKIRDAYLEHTDPRFDYSERLSQQLLGHEIPQIFLVHANEINADNMEVLLKRIEKRGYNFVTLDHAMKDPAYQQPDEYVGPYGPSWLLRWQFTKTGTMDKNEPDPPKWVMELHEKKDQ